MVLIVPSNLRRTYTFSPRSASEVTFSDLQCMMFRKPDGTSTYVIAHSSVFEITHYDPMDLRGHSYKLCVEPLISASARHWTIDRPPAM